ncbi:MAG TPA: SprT-like domain-containing protein [Candidatus Janibacter merdipullorum]|nr:SprT-like domain-containing protein [Candidatus Janibacter merdipullorum]
MDIGDAREMARGLMDEHGLEDWTLLLDRAKRRAGVCRYTDRAIGLSRHLTLIHTPDQVRDTVLHEIAHAHAGPRAAHGPRWQAAATAIGARPERCLPAEAGHIPGSWVGTCPAGHTIDRHRRPSRVLSCRECSRGFTLEAVFEWTHHGVPTDPGPAYLRELESIRRRDRGRRSGARHGWLVS